MTAVCLAALDLTRYSATLVLAAFALVGILIGVLYKTGILGLVLWFIFALGGACIDWGYRVWDRFLSGLQWYGLAGILVGLHLLRWPFDFPPLVTALIGGTLLTIGAITVLAYMYIDTERYEVSRGYKALHSPVKGQHLAEGLAKHGDQVGYAMLVTAILSCISGFSLMNLGLSDSVGARWYQFNDRPTKEQVGRLERAAEFFFGARGHEKTDSYADFLAYTMINLAYLVDLIDVVNERVKQPDNTGEASTGIAFVRAKEWPAKVLLATFRLFFSFVLLQQLTSLVRHGRLLGESVQDLWSPYAPIQLRAAEHLKQQGPDAVPILLASIEAMAPLSGEQRQLIPQVVANIGPATVPLLSRSLDHPSDDVRAVAIAALGNMRAWWALPDLAVAAEDPSPAVRIALAATFVEIASLGVPAIRKQWALGKSSAPRRRWLRLLARTEMVKKDESPDPVVAAVTALRTLLRDHEREARLRAAEALALLGQEGASAAPELLDLAREDDDSCRAAAARCLGVVGGPAQESVTALLHLLSPPVPSVLTPALTSLGALGKEAARAVPSIIPLLQHEDEEVRVAAAEAMKKIGHVDAKSLPQLVAELSSADDLERARAAEALATIGPAAEATAPALIGALGDNSDSVRALAARALGKLGIEPATESVPALARALGDQHSTVAASAAEALGELGEVAGAAVAELRQALRHINGEVRRHAALAFSKLGGLEPADVRALEPLTRDEDSNVRRQAVLTLACVEELPESTRAVLHEAAEDVDPEVRAAVVRVLGREHAEQDVEGFLLHALDDSSELVKIEATRALGILTTPSPRALEALTKLMAGEAENVSVAAAAALGQLGSRAETVVPQLRERLENGTPPVREQVLRALVQIQPADGFEVYAAALHDPSADIRRLGSAGLMKMRTLPPEGLPLLADGLRDPDPQVCANFAYVCSRLDRLPVEVVPLLLGHTTSPDDGLRLNALRALRSVPVVDGDPVLGKMLEDPNLQIALQAASVLVQHDARTDGVEKVLAKALSAGVLFREQALAALAECAPEQPGLRRLLERLWESVDAVEVREQLTKLLGRLQAVESP